LVERHVLARGEGGRAGVEIESDGLRASPNRPREAQQRQEQDATANLAAKLAPRRKTPLSGIEPPGRWILPGRIDANRHGTVRKFVRCAEENRDLF
jgi:hypothetical protein